MVNRSCIAEIVQLGVKDFKLLCVGAHLVLWKMWTTLVGQCAQRHKFQPMTGGADLCVDLQAALQLVLIKRPKRSVKWEVDILDLPAATSGHCATGQAEGQTSAEYEFFEHSAHPITPQVLLRAWQSHRSRISQLLRQSLLRLFVVVRLAFRSHQAAAR